MVKRICGYCLLILLAACAPSTTEVAGSVVPTQVATVAEQLPEISGTFEFDDVKLMIPEGALFTDETLNIRQVEFDELPVDIPPLTDFLGAVECGPDGLTFENPISLFIPLSEEMEPFQMLGLYVYDHEAQAFVDTGIPARVTDDGFFAVAEIDHFSVYTVLDGLTGQKLGRRYTDLLEDGTSPESAFQEMWDYVLSKSPDLDDCLDQGFRLAGIELYIVHSEADDTTRNIKWVGEETSRLTINTMMYVKRTEDQTTVYDIAFIQYLGEECTSSLVTYWVLETDSIEYTHVRCETDFDPSIVHEWDYENHPRGELKIYFVGAPGGSEVVKPLFPWEFFGRSSTNGYSFESYDFSGDAFHFVTLQEDRYESHNATDFDGTNYLIWPGKTEYEGTVQRNRITGTIQASHEFTYHTDPGWDCTEQYEENGTFNGCACREGQPSDCELCES